MPSVTVALEDDGLLHLRLPLDEATVHAGPVMAGVTQGVLARTTWGEGHVDFEVLLNARPEPVDKPAPTPALSHAWTDAQVAAATRRRLESDGIDYESLSRYGKVVAIEATRATLDAALAAGPMPVARAAEPEAADDEDLVEELAGELRATWHTTVGAEDRYDREARAALAWMRGRGRDAATVALVRAARKIAATTPAVREALVPFAAVPDGEAGA